MISGFSLRVEPHRKVFIDCDENWITELLFLAIAGILTDIYPEYDTSYDEMKLYGEQISNPKTSVRINIGNAYTQISGIYENTDSEVRLFENASEAPLLQGIKNKNVFKLSGGELQRLILSRSLISKPGLWLCQNQFAELDAENKQELLTLVSRSHAIVIIHDWFERHFADYIDEFYSLQRSDLETAYTLAPMRSTDLQRIHPNTDIRFKQNKEAKVKISIKDLTFSFGKSNLFSKKSMIFREGLNFLIGNNGSGKTTLFNILTGVIESNRFNGVIKIDGQQLDNYLKNRPIGIAFQNPELCLFYPTVKPELSIGLQENPIIIKQGLEILNLNQHLHSELSSLPFPLKKKLTILSSLNRNPEIVLLDEPTQSLNRKDTTEVKNLIEYLLEKGRTIICVTHSKEFILLFDAMAYSLVCI